MDPSTPPAVDRTSHAWSGWWRQLEALDLMVHDTSRRTSPTVWQEWIRGDRPLAPGMIRGGTGALAWVAVLDPSGRQEPTGVWTVAYDSTHARMALSDPVILPSFAVALGQWKEGCGVAPPNGLVRYPSFPLRVLGDMHTAWTDPVAVRALVARQTLLSAWSESQFERHLPDLLRLHQVADPIVAAAWLGRARRMRRRETLLAETPRMRLVGVHPGADDEPRWGSLEIRAPVTTRRSHEVVVFRGPEALVADPEAPRQWGWIRCASTAPRGTFDDRRLIDAQQATYGEHGLDPASARRVRAWLVASRSDTIRQWHPDGPGVPLRRARVEQLLATDPLIAAWMHTLLAEDHPDVRLLGLLGLSLGAARPRDALATPPAPGRPDPVRVRRRTVR